MRQSPFIWLGSGRSRRRKIARKGRLLDQAARAGLPVPSGGILLDDFYQICLSEGLVELEAEELVVPVPIWLLEVLYRDVRFPRLEKSTAVRSAAVHSAGESHSGTTAYLDVDFNDPLQVAEALRKVWTAMNRLNAEQSHDILVMEMISIQTAGEALSASGSTKDQIKLIEGTDKDSPGSFTLEKLRIFQRASSGLPPYARRLQKLLRGVRRSFGKGDWRFDWADDGQICWLMQIY